MFDLTISLGSVLTLVSFLVAAVVYVVGGRATTQVLDTRLSMIDAQIEDFKQEMRKLSEIIVQQAVQNKRLENIEERMLSEGKRIDSMAQTIRDIMLGNINRADKER